MRHDKELRVKVSNELVGRALGFIEMLIRRLEASGIKIELIDRNNRPNAYQILADGEQVKCVLIEEINRVERADDDERKSSLLYGRWEWKRTGRLRFEIDEYTGSNKDKKWSDKTGKTLEHQLDEIVKAFFTCAKDLKRLAAERQALHLQWEAEQRSREEAAKRIALEQASRQRLEAQAEQWARCKNLTSFIDACEKQMLDQNSSGLPVESREAIWLTWARAHVQRLDPLNNGFPKG